MIAQGPTHRDAASSEEKLSQESRPTGGRSPRPESDTLDLARLTPKQIAAELARRSQGSRAGADTAAERAEFSAGFSPAVSSKSKAEDEASPFARLTQALSPREAMSPAMEARAAEDRAAEERAAERRRLKEQYVQERYRHEEEHDIREAARRAAENAGRTRPVSPIGGGDLSPDDPLQGEKRIADYARHAAPASPPSFSAAATIADEPVRPNAAQTMPIDRLGARRDQRAGADRMETSPEAASTEARRSEARWGELRAPDLRAPEDIRGLVTTSFERPMKPAAGRRLHGVLILAAAVVVGLALYFHPWSGPEEGQMRADLPSDRAAPVQGKPGGTAANSPAPALAPTPVPTSAPPSMPAAEAKPAAPQPRSAASDAARSGIASPPPAVEMTPLPTQPAPPVTQPTAAGNGAAPASPSPETPSATAGTASNPPAPAPIAAAKPTAGEVQKMTTAPGAARPPEIKRAAKPVESDPRESAATQKPKEAYIKPSPAWLRVQPYDPGAAAAPEPAESTPDAWMKPRPYNPGVLTPPGN